MNAPTAGQHQLLARDEVDGQLLPVLLEEADETLPKIAAGLEAWYAQPANEQHALTVTRLLHTLKGSARMTGAMRFGELLHRMEGLLQSVAYCEQPTKYHEVLKRDFIHVQDLLDELRNNAGGLAHETLPDALATTTLTALSERLYRIVRQTCKELNKRAHLEISSNATEVNHDLLEKMTSPLEHLVRNAVAHGIETPERRRVLGKPPVGEIHLSIGLENGEFVIDLSDDGAGLDMALLQQKALDAGVLDIDGTITIEQAVAMIFSPGVSTAKEVTEISGRGIGLDVVRNEVHQLGGRITVASSPNHGMCFTIYLPQRTTGC